MFKLENARSILKKMKRDESGITTISWALSLTVIIGAMGAAMDFAVLSGADQKSQSIADTTSLAAAIYIKNNGRPPTGEGELAHGDHTAAALGYNYKDFVVEGAEGVNVRINYDDNAKEVTTTVTGKTNPILVQILGFSDLNFSATSVVSYLDIENKFPASIALVLDNSGSMQFDDKLPERIYDVTHSRTCQRWVWDRGWKRQSYNCPWTHKHGDQKADAKIRLDGLKSSVLRFQSDLETRLGTEDDSSRRTVRMGMLPYSSAIIAAGQRNMNWGYIPEGTNNGNTGIRGMKADGGTNSSPPMTTAKEWLEAENSIHEREAERVGEVNGKDPLKFVIFMTDGQNTVGNRDIIPGPTGRWYRETSPGNFSQSGAALSGYIEGTLALLTDAETVDSCQQMKNQGVKIFTIGYALEDHGQFRVNGWNGNEDDSLFEVSSDVRASAYSMLQSCASSDEHFITAADAGQLESAFDEIQNAIVEELIRIKS